MNISGKKSLSVYFVQYGAVLLISVCLLLYVLRVFGKEGENSSFADYTADGAEMEKLVAGKRETENLLGESGAGLSLDGYEIPMEAEKQLFYISQPLAGSGWQGDLRPHGAGLSILADEYAEDFSRAVRDGHIFEAVLYTEDAYQKIGIVLTGMPVVNILTEREEPREYPIEDIDNYVFNSETRYYGEITIFQSGLSAFSETEKRYQIMQRDVCYHERGQNSALFSKKSYAVKLLNKQGEGRAESLFGMPYSTKWKMLAMYSDPNKIRDKVSMELWKEIAEKERQFNEKGPVMEYCEVLMDGEYMGIYGMMLPVNEKTLGLGQGDVLYKILDWYMPAEEEIQASIAQDYMVCYPVRIRYPEKGQQQTEKLWEPVIRYFSCKYWNTDFNIYGDMTCPENLSDYYIFIQTVSGFDNYLKNTYVYAREADNAAGYQMITVPWDLNYTFGNCYVYEAENYTDFNPDASVNYVEPVLEQLFRSNFGGEAEVLKERWGNYRKDILSTEHITELLQDNMDYLLETGAFGRDTDKWEEADNSSDLSEVKDYVERRMCYLDEYFAGF